MDAMTVSSDTRRMLRLVMRRTRRRIHPFVRQRQRSLTPPDLTRVVRIPSEPRCPCCSGRMVGA